MIDRIKINKIVGELPPRVYKGKGWKRVSIQREGAGYKYRYWDRGISYTYYPDSGRLEIYGKLINLSRNRYSIDTLSDLYFDRTGLDRIDEPVFDEEINVTEYKYYYEAYVQELDEVIDAMNQYVNVLLAITVDVRIFSPTRIEFCYNVKTKDVEDYIKMFNLVLSERNPAAYKNYVLEKELLPYSSFYVRSVKKYDENSKASVTANFYNKEDETKYRIAEALKKSIKKEEPELPYQLLYQNVTTNILRLEAIYGYKALYKVRNEYGIGKTLLDFINPQLSRDIIAKRYTHLVGGEDLGFYSYQAAKKKIEESGLGREKKLNLIKYIRYHKGACSRNPDSGVYRRRDDLAGLGIHWCLIPWQYGTDFLESPIHLLDWQLGNLDDAKGIRNRRRLMIRTEADMSNSITVADDGVIQIPEAIIDDLETLT